jgi:hypothetical protein
MHKILAVVFTIFSFQFVHAQALQSPDQYLGYTLGTKYTRHYKIVEYFNYVAKNASSQVKFTKYGSTNEDRDLNLAFISSPENIVNLEKIRLANMQKTHLINGTDKSDVAIVWLSYNVHGNEPSSSEAAMKTLYELVTKQSDGWLKNTLVIIDPCLNPDGRDRYVNWYNGMVGTNANSNVLSREHQEPWPGGRVNHYYYDLNRDWAWQTQVETKQRLLVYNQWMPHVHVDFHEQGYNEPYYFAPAAEPMHEVITKWQRDFQTQIGQNNAKYFDENGWYYFTKERFDLFYPSYGDTYPTFNGSIGMTYEQGGHSKGGLSVKIDNGDTLTLVDRVKHHFTTGMSTVEVASLNNKSLVNNFAQYFDNSMNAVGSTYKSYILTSDVANKIEAVQKLLITNGIKFDKINAVTGTGLNYANNKTENIVCEKYTIAISAYQPKSLLAKVLLEPTTSLSDTVTYDITAWSLPYVYAVKAYASTNKIATTNANAVATLREVPTTNYALYVPYNSIEDGKTLAQLLASNAKIYVNEIDIISKGRKFGKGTILIPKKENIKNWKKIEEVLKNSTSEIVAVNSGFADKGPDLGSPDIKFIAAPRIACATGEEVGSSSSGEVWHFFDKEINYPVTMMNSYRIGLNSLKNIDVLIMPDGDYSLLASKGNAEDLKTWVKQGGRLILMENAAIQAAKIEWGIKMRKNKDDDDKKDDDKKEDEAKDEKKGDDKKTYELIKAYENRERESITKSIPGAIYEVELDNTHPIGFGFEKSFYMLKQNSEVMEFSKKAWNVGVIKKNKKVSGFAGAKVLEKLKDGTVLCVQEVDNGQVIYFTDDPIFRSFWENGKLLFFNAAFLVGNDAVRL